MRKILTIICALIVAALMPAALLVSRGLPADTRPYVEKKYAGWNGVLQAWICCRWSPGGSFISWLNACAADFEKAHEGVYIEFTPVSEEAMRSIGQNGIRPPDMIFFSPGVLTDDSRLLPLSMPDALRSEFSSIERALPVAMGGYAWVYNRGMVQSPPQTLDDITSLRMLPDDTGRCFSAALAALLSGGTGEDPSRPLPDAGIDLGLEASAAPSSFSASPEALDAFIDGELAFMPVTQHEIARLTRLRENGRGPDWDCAAGGDFAWVDQLLLMGIPRSDQSDAGERAGLSRDFAALLLADEAQTRLADAGAFSTSGEMIHSSFSTYEQLDALLAGRPLALPDVFSEHSAGNHAGIIRSLLSGEISSTDALVQIGLRFSLQDHPN